MRARSGIYKTQVHKRDTAIATIKSVWGDVVWNTIFVHIEPTTAGLADVIRQAALGEADLKVAQRMVVSVWIRRGQNRTRGQRGFDSITPSDWYNTAKHLKENSETGRRALLMDDQPMQTSGFQIGRYQLVIPASDSNGSIRVLNRIASGDNSCYAPNRVSPLGGT
ncbi:MAG: hypothetical protein MMC23_002479 [Stictis urceolatum]|nr:hypothetical protein [Stictis urceolata]